MVYGRDRAGHRSLLRSNGGGVTHCTKFVVKSGDRGAAIFVGHETARESTCEDVVNRCVAILGSISLNGGGQTVEVGCGTQLHLVLHHT